MVQNKNKIINRNKRINNNVRHNGLKINIHGGAAGATGATGVTLTFTADVNSLTKEFFGTDLNEFNNDDDIKFKLNDNKMIENWDFSKMIYIESQKR